MDIVANTIFNKIFFSPGYPYDWGSNIYVNESNLLGFGLAAYSQEPYKLDVDKIMRLYPKAGNTTNPLYIPPTTVGRLLGIYGDGYWKYGFSIEIVTALNITLQPEDPDATPPDVFYVSVKNYEGRPATNALVKGVLYAVFSEGGGRGAFDILYDEAYNYTDITGSTILNFNVTELPTQRSAYLVLVMARYYGIQSHAVYAKGNILSMIIQGQYIILNMSGIGDIIPSARHLKVSAIEFTSDHGIIINPLIDANGSEAERIINKGRYNYRVYQLANPISEDVILLGLLVVTRSRYYLVFAERPRTPVSLVYTSHGYLYAGSKTSVVSGLFRIGGITYYAELRIWRMSE